MMYWIPLAFVRIVLVFIGGIILYLNQPHVISPESGYSLIFLCCLLFGLLAFIFHKTGNKIYNPGWAGLLVVFLGGYLHTGFQTASRNPKNIVQRTTPIEYYVAVVDHYAEKKPRSWKVRAEVQKICYQNRWEEASGKVVIYLPQAEFENPFRYGDVLLIKGAPQLLQPPGNPGEFNYAQFLSYRQMYHQHYLPRDNVAYLERNPPNIFMAAAYQARDWAHQELARFVPGEREQNVASALVLGVTDGLDDELLSAYAATGSMHVLAVSGLHISIIYWIVLFLCSPLKKVRGGTWIVTGICFIILWSYAFVTGLSPSVLRAVTMFSMVALARAWNKHTNIFNTLAASAFLLLLFDPYLIMSVGFQLSFLAVLGIVYLYPAFYRWLEWNSRVGDEVWKIICVSVAAQVATFSLGLLYFHQFPTYFLFSNLVVIPGSFGILVMGLVVLALSFFSAAASLIGTALSWIIKMVNAAVFLVEDLPFSLMDNIQITTVQCWLLIGMVVGFVLLFDQHKPAYAGLVFIAVISFSVVDWKHTLDLGSHPKFTVYKVPGHTAIDFIGNGQAFFIMDETLQQDSKKIAFHLRPNRLQSGVHHVLSGTTSATLRETDFGKLMVWNGKSVLYLDNKGAIPYGVSVDYVIIGNNAVENLSDFLKAVRTEHIILDSSNSFSHSTKLQAQARTLEITLHSVLHRGAFTQNT